jgi:dTMP kinase
MSGFFITFEGGEGSGKTTQINRLSKALTDLGHKVITSREPGGTPEAEKIRDLIVQKQGGDWTPTAETLLLYAARVMHVAKIIRPALDEGKIVICDRFTDSTLAYQGYGHGADHHMIEQINLLTLGHTKPDLTFILDIAPEKGLARAGRRMASQDLDVQQREDKFEDLDLEFHKRLREGFLDIAHKDDKRCLVVDADRPLDVLAEEIKNHTLARIR